MDKEDSLGDSESELVLSDEGEEQVIEMVLPEDDKETEAETVQGEGARHVQKARIEVIYILFFFYREDMRKIADRYGCKVDVTMNFYSIKGPEAMAKEEFGECVQEIRRFVRQIEFEEVVNQGVWDQSYTHANTNKYFFSGFIRKHLEERNIQLIQFHKKVFAFSRSLRRDQIKREMLQLAKDKAIYAVRFRKPKLREFAEHTDIMREFNRYLLKIIDHYEDFFEQRGIRVEINQPGTCVYIIGAKPKYLMECKITIKNVIESVVCLVVKDFRVKIDPLSKYLSKVSKYPIHLANYHGNNCLLMSKDNILKQLMKSSKKIFEHIGVVSRDAEKEDNEMTPKYGIFLIPSISLERKVNKMKLACKEKGYDLYKYHYIRYLGQVFSGQSGMKKDNSSVLKELLVDIMVSLEDAKQRYDVMRRVPDDKHPKRVEPETENPLKYKVLGGRDTEAQLSKALRRDVLTERVLMNKQFIIAFNCIEDGEETTVYWKMKPNGEEDERVPVEKLKPGQYLRGKQRKNEHTEASLFEEIITVI